MKFLQKLQEFSKNQNVLFFLQSERNDEMHKKIIPSKNSNSSPCVTHSLICSPSPRNNLFKEKFKSLDIEKDNNFIKKIIMQYEENIIKYNRMILDNIRAQKLKFSQNKIKKCVFLDLPEFSRSKGLKTVSPIKRNLNKTKNESIFNSNENFVSRKKVKGMKTDVILRIKPKYSLRTVQSVLGQNINKSLTFNEIFEDYIEKMKYIYFKNIISQILEESVKSLIDNYYNNIQMFNTYSEDIGELYKIWISREHVETRILLKIEEIENEISESKMVNDLKISNFLMKKVDEKIDLMNLFLDCNFIESNDCFFQNLIKTFFIK